LIRAQSEQSTLEHDLHDLLAASGRYSDEGIIGKAPLSNSTILWERLETGVQCTSHDLNAVASAADDHRATSPIETAIQQQEVPLAPGKPNCIFVEVGWRE